MFINTKNIAVKALILISAAALIFTSCAQLGEEQEGAYGYLTIGGFDVDVQVEQLLPTKGEGTVYISKVRGYSAPSISSVTVTSIQDNSKTYTWSGNALRLPAGEYTLKATCGSNAFDASYFMGEGRVEVPSGAEVEGKVTFTLANSVMQVINQMTDHVDSSKPVTISAESGNLETAYGTYVFVPSEQTLRISGYNTAGVEFVKEISSLNPNIAYDVKLSTNDNLLPEITLPEQQDGAWGGRLYVNPVTSVDGMSSDNLSKIVYNVYSDEACETRVGSSSQDNLVVDGLENNKKYYVQAKVGNLFSEPREITVVAPEVTAEHYNDASGNLAGTKATLYLKLNDFLKDRIIVDEITLVKGTTTMRTAPASGQTTMTVANNYPYLPQGTDYVLNVRHKLKTEPEYKTSSMAGIEVPAPEFTVTVTGTTTYDKYLAYKAGTGSLEDANQAGKAEYIFQIGSKITGISEKLLKNTNYGTNVYYTCGPYQDVEYVFINGDGDKNPDVTIHNIGDIEGFSWGANTLTATVDFAGTQKSDSKTCYITGLPYSISFEDNIQPTGWTLSNNGSSYSRLVLKWGNAYAITPAFGIVNTIDVKCNLSAYAYRGSVGSYKPTVSIHASEIGVNSTVNKTLDGISNLPYSTNYESITSDITLTDSVEKVCIYTSGKGSDWSVGSGDMGVVCQNFSIIYR